MVFLTWILELLFVLAPIGTRVYPLLEHCECDGVGVSICQNKSFAYVL
uniref:Uncharacterized protein n=1 Tax=Lotus japonicus TaxID=34305 RepID=I3SKG8_LOTJA|nr:unknown [Lotus japonicus]